MSSLITSLAQWPNIVNKKEMEPPKGLHDCCWYLLLADYQGCSSSVSEAPKASAPISEAFFGRALEVLTSKAL